MASALYKFAQILLCKTSDFSIGSSDVWSIKVSGVLFVAEEEEEAIICLQNQSNRKLFSNA